MVNEIHLHHHRKKLPSLYKQKCPVKMYSTLFICKIVSQSRAVKCFFPFSAKSVFSALFTICSCCLDMKAGTPIRKTLNIRLYRLLHPVSIWKNDIP